MFIYYNVALRMRSIDQKESLGLNSKRTEDDKFEKLVGLTIQGANAHHVSWQDLSG